MDLYTGKIDEFVDWTTGVSSVTNQSATNGATVSGKSIRTLLQDRLKKPFTLFQNTNIGKYQIFSSDGAKELYDGGGHDELLLGEFEGPSGYKINSVLVSGEYNYLTLNSNSSENVIFKWQLVNNADGTTQPAYCSIRITIVNNNVKIYDFSDGNSSQSNLNQDGDSYQYKYTLDIHNNLQPGTNYVTITISAPDYGASVTLNATYNVIEFNLKENLFNNFLPVSSNAITIKPEYTTSTLNTVTVYAYIDEDLVYESPSESGEQIILRYNKMTEGEHYLTVFIATTVLNVEYRSNVILKKFVREYSDISNTNTVFLFNVSLQRNDNSYIEQLKKGNISFLFVLYSRFSMDWGLYNIDSTRLYSSVNFYLSDSEEKLENELLIGLFSNINANIGSEEPITFLPKELYQTKYIGYIIGSGLFKSIGQTNVQKFPYADLIKEAASYVFKFDAFGKNNQNDFTWEPETGIEEDLSEVNVDLSKINFTALNGWYQDSIRTQGSNYGLTINNLPFDATTLRNSFTFEIDFLIEGVHNDNDVLVDVGGFIKIFPNRAVLYDNNNTKIIETNYRYGERTKIAFIKYPASSTNSVWSNLYLIVTNGIMERGALPNTNPKNPTRTITIGGCDSGIRVYNMRYYNSNLDWKSCYNNWIFDADEKTSIIERNSVYFTSGNSATLGEVDESKVAGMMDVIKIQGNILQLVNTGEKIGMMVDSITRACPTDQSKNFTITNCYIRTHGQSNIEYPVPSFKFWSNKKNKDDDPDPILTLDKISQQYTKGRMQVYNDAIPANKWVLQSNFADSSCAHNGAFLRLINDTWYNAAFLVGGKTEFKLRTPPQLFTTNQTITPLDDGLASDTNYNHGYNNNRRLWKDYAGSVPFPYQIRNAPNSFPCLLFYRAKEDDPWSFFGQYVFMDDKKTEYEYGERSIYYKEGLEDDPFVQRRANIPKSDKNPDGLRAPGSAKYDTGDYRIWDNKNVIRIEVLDVDGDEVNFLKSCEGCPQSKYYTKWSDDRDSRVPNTSFEMIYPDIDDMTDAELEADYGTFLQFHDWVVSTKNNASKFLKEAAAHMDLYKLAAYYIFFVMFGLVDSVNRNAQWKTYDGIHWWIEPWDMDVALGTQNNGGIAYDPPIDRNTPGAGLGIGAFSGKGSVLWNNLENWEYWMKTIVPTVAQALYDAGLKYDKVVSLLDDDYSKQWPEYIYNKSGEYKYIYSGKKNEYIEPKYLPWLQGARLSHRHWWLSTSMDYWYSKMGRGAFTANHIKVDTNIPAGLGVKVKITPSSKAFFAYYFQQGGFPSFTEQGYDENGLIEVDFTINESFSTKKPFYICGLSSIQRLDISDLGSGFAGVNLNAESPMTELNIGAALENGNLSYVNMTTANFNDFIQNLPKITTINVSGQYGMNTFLIPNTITKFYAAASSYIKGFSATSNVFTELTLPNSHNDKSTGTKLLLGSLILKDCSWDTIQFIDSDNIATPQKQIVQSDGEDTIYRELYTGTYKEAELLTIRHIELTGKTCKGTNANNAKDLMLKWFNSDYAQSLSTEDKRAAVKLDNVEWEGISYSDVLTIAEFYNTISPNIKGKIAIDSNEVISDQQLSVLTQLFGDTVFKLGSNGLVIDYPVDKNVISIGSPATLEDGIYNIDEASGKEGVVNVKIDYVRFKLRATSGKINWILLSEKSGIWTRTTLAGKAAVVDHGNISIVEVEDPETETTSYYLRITESNTSTVKSEYKFRLGVYGVDAYVEIHVTPVKQSISLTTDASESAGCKITNDFTLFRSAQSSLKVVATLGGNSMPTSTEWQIVGQVTSFLKIVSSGTNFCNIQPYATDDQQLPTVETVGQIMCTARYRNGSKVTYYMIKIKRDALVLTGDESYLLYSCNQALGLTDADQLTEMYESDIAEVLDLTLSLIFNYTTHTGLNIFKYLTAVTHLCITQDTLAEEYVLEISNKENMPKLSYLELDGVMFSKQDLVLDIKDNNHIKHLSTHNCDFGVTIASGISAELGSPSYILCLAVTGTITVDSLDNLTSLSIYNDTSTLYPDPDLKWLQFVPMDHTLNNITISTSGIINLGKDLDRIFNLLKRMPASSMFQNIGSIYCNSYHAEMSKFPTEINQAIKTNNDYYLLYNDDLYDSKALYDAFDRWASQYEKDWDWFGDPKYGYTYTDVYRFGSSISLYAPDHKSSIKLTGISSIKFTKYTRSGLALTTTTDLFPLSMFSEIDLSETSCDPYLTQGGNLSKLMLGDPDTITITGSYSLSGDNITIKDVSKVKSVNVSNIQKIFTWFFSTFKGRISLISGTINGNQSIVASDTTLNNVVQTGLAESSSVPGLIFKGTLTANGAYISERKYNAIISRCTQFTLNIQNAYESLDVAVLNFIEKYNIVKEDTFKPESLIEHLKPVIDKLEEITLIINGSRKTVIMKTNVSVARGSIGYKVYDIWVAKTIDDVYYLLGGKGLSYSDYNSFMSNTVVPKLKLLYPNDTWVDLLNTTIMQSWDYRQDDPISSFTLKDNSVINGALLPLNVTDIINESFKDVVYFPEGYYYNGNGEITANMPNCIYTEFNDMSRSSQGETFLTTNAPNLKVIRVGGLNRTGGKVYKYKYTSWKFNGVLVCEYVSGEYLRAQYGIVHMPDSRHSYFDKFILVNDLPDSDEIIGMLKTMEGSSDIAGDFYEAYKEKHKEKDY